MINPLSKASQPSVDAANMPLDQLAANSHVSKEAKIKEASRQFESILVQQILSEAQKSSAGHGVSGGIYQDMVTTHLADGITRAGGLGLSRSLESSFSQHQNKVTGSTELKLNPGGHSASRPAGDSVEKSTKPFHL